MINNGNLESYNFWLTHFFLVELTLKFKNKEDKIYHDLLLQSVIMTFKWLYILFCTALSTITTNYIRPKACAKKKYECHGLQA